jgi:hypothetical protein
MKRAIGTWILCGVLSAGPAFAQSKTGTTIGQFLGIEPSARVAAMGNAGVALYDGIQSVYYNPAAMGAVEATSIQFTHSLWFADIAYDYAAAAVPVRGWGTFFASVTALNSGEIDVRTVEQPLGTGERYTVADLALGLGYGRRITQTFGAGVQLNYVNESIWNSSMHVLTFSAGTLYQLPESGVRLGASLSNFGTQGRFDGRDLAILYDNDPDRYGDNSSLPGRQSTDEFPVPILFRVGLAVPYQLNNQSKVVFAADAFHPNDNTESLSLGQEWSWKDTVFLRAGYQTLFQTGSDMGLTLGVGVRGGAGDALFHFDYAWADHSRLQETHRMTFALSF